MSAAPGARSPLVAILVGVLGLAGLVKFLEWYWDHLKQIGNPPRVAAALPARPAQPSPPPSPTPTPLLPATATELAGLASGDAAEQMAALERLTTRAMTPELEQAARACVPADERVARKLECLQARLPGPQAVAQALERLPQADDAIWPSDVDHCLCLAEALAARVHEAPEPIVRGLVPLALSLVGRLRNVALRGLAEAPLTEISPEVRRQLRESWHESLAVRAGFALRADELAPELVHEWLGSDPKSRGSAIQALVTTRRATAARLLVDQALNEPQAKELQGAVARRQQALADLTSPLLEVALDAGDGLARRQAALELLAAYGGAEALPRLAELESSDDAVVKAYAVAAGHELRRRHHRP